MLRHIVSRRCSKEMKKPSPPSPLNYSCSGKASRMLIVELKLSQESRRLLLTARESPPLPPSLIPNHSLAPTVREHILMYVLNPFCPSCSMLSVIVSATDERNYIFLITFRECLNQKEKKIIFERHALRVYVL